MFIPPYWLYSANASDKVIINAMASMDVRSNSRSSRLRCPKAWANGRANLSIWSMASLKGKARAR